MTRVLQPGRLKPVDLDLPRVLWVGTALWAVAVLVTGALALTGHLAGRTVAICGTGVVLGLLGVWVRRRQAP